MNQFDLPRLSSAYLLVFHGSRDRRSQDATTLLMQRVCESIASVPKPDSDCPMIQAAFLDCHPLPLSDQVVQFAKQALAVSPSADTLRLLLIPVFLLPGIHLMEDIPAEVAVARAAIAKELPKVDVILEIAPHLGAHPGLRRLLSRRMATIAAEAWILLAHGSSRPGANQPIEALAKAIGATVAYLSVPSSLESALMHLQTLGTRQIGILPHVLFQGKITDAIAQSITQYSTQFPDLHLTLADTLDTSPDLAHLLVDLATNQG